MDDASLQRVCELASRLRQFTHLLLQPQHKLSLDTWTLCEIQEAFGLILEMEQHTNFHVLPANHRQHPAIHQLQCLYDLMQKVQGLRLWAKQGHTLPSDQILNLRCLRSLHTLELDHVPVCHLRGLQNLRGNLHRLVVIKSISQLSDLLIRCGADKAGEFEWEQLQEAVFCHNPLRCLDRSLGLLPQLKVLDVSHCSLEDASAIEYLTCVTFLDLSHNQIKNFPLLSPSAARSVVILLMNNNLLTQISGIGDMTNLEQLDLRDNLLVVDPIFSPLCALPHLRVLEVYGNPVAWDANYRIRVVRKLNRAVASHGVVLDGQPLSPSERVEVGRQASGPMAECPPELLSSIHSSLHPIHPLLFRSTIPQSSTSCEWVVGSKFTQETSELEDSMSSSVSLGGSRIGRKTKARHVAIIDPVVDNSTEYAVERDEGFPCAPPPSLAIGNGFLSMNSESIAEALTTLKYQHKSKDHAVEQSDRLLEEILQQQTKENISDAAASSSGDAIGKVVSLSVGETMVCDKKENSSNNLESSFYLNESEDRCRESSMSPEHCEKELSDDEKDDNNLKLFLARRSNPESKVNDELDDSSFEDLILAITRFKLKEKHHISARTLARWDRQCIQKVSLLSTSPHSIQFIFDTSRSSMKIRTYVLEADDAQGLLNALQQPINGNITCPVCDSASDHMQGLQRDNSPSAKCPSCRRKLNVLNWSDFPRSSTPLTGSANHSTSGSVAVVSSDSSGSQGESSESVSVCSEEPSLARGRGDSDLEVISNQSVSSIEVLIEQQQLIREDEENEHNWQMETKVPTVVLVNTDAHSPPTSPGLKRSRGSLPNMQESSSSGSMTGSVCTTYEKNGSCPTSPIKDTDFQPRVEVIRDDCNTGVLPSTVCPTFHHRAVMTSFCSDTLATSTELNQTYSLSAWVTGLLGGLTGYYWNWWRDGGVEIQNGRHCEPNNPMRYNFEDFADVDHRLKLHCEVLLFHEPAERLLGLVKAVILMSDEKEEFQGLCVLSNFKVYILQIIGNEGDSPQTWLLERLTVPLPSVLTVFSLYHRQGLALTLANTSVLLSLADSHRCNCFFNFLSESLDECGVNPDVTECSPRQEEALWEAVKEVVKGEEQEGVITAFAIVASLLDNGESQSQFLVVTEYEMLLFRADLRWYFPPCPGDVKLRLSQSEKIADVVTIEVFSDTHLVVHFADEATNRESTWALHVPSAVAACHVVQAVRTPWAQLFGVDLQVVQHSSASDQTLLSLTLTE